MPTDTASPYWLELGHADLRFALRMLKPKGLAAARARGDLQLGFSHGEAILCVRGTEARCPASGHWPGLAVCSFRHALAFLTFKPRPGAARLEFEAGKLRYESLRIKAMWVGASPLLAGLSMEAHFLGAVNQDSEARMFCPACGKRAGIPLESLVRRAAPTSIEALLEKLARETSATHGCEACGHGWAELDSLPREQYRLL